MAQGLLCLTAMNSSKTDSQGFAFRLEVVLKQRIRQCDEKQREVARITEIVNQAKELLLEAEQDMVRRDTPSVLAHGTRTWILDPDEEMVRSAWRKAAMEALQARRDLVTRAEKECESARKRLEQALQEKLAMERIKEQALQRHNEVRRKMEENELDELTTQRFCRS